MQVKALLMLVHQSPSFSRAYTLLGQPSRWFGLTPGRYGPRRIREEIFLAHVAPVGKESRCFGKANRLARFRWERIGIVGVCPAT